jgi:signal transduction histidine kinase
LLANPESAREPNELQAAQTKSAEMSPAVGRVIRIVGHDLKNKLGVMTNSIYYLNMKLGNGDAKVQKHLRIMRREVTNATRMISNLMDFALTKEPVLRQGDVKTIVVEALSQASLPDGWETAIHLEDGLPSLMADALQLQRAFTNIILRIVEGMPSGGRLQISAGVQDGFVELGFGAAGLIIPEENLTGAAAPLASAGGTSLGMAVSKMLVESHGGTIEAKRLSRDGTVFVVKLPL